MTIELIMKAVEKVELSLKAMDEKASGEMRTLGEISKDTKTAIETLGTEQRTLADRILQLEQKGLIKGGEGDEGRKGDESVGSQFIKSAELKSFVERGHRGKFGVELKNTVTNTVGNTFSERRPGVVSGAFRQLRLEALLTSLPTSSNAVEYVRENTFTNAAAETAEASAKPESAITTSLQTDPVATVGHWLKISKQLAADFLALAAYINTRMIYGVNLRVENQIIAGTGVAPNMSGFTKAGNFTAHGYAAATLTALNLSAINRFDLIGKMIGDSQASDYPADAILLNPTDWWTLRLTKDVQGRYLLGDPGIAGAQVLFDVPVITSNAVAADTVGVGSLAMAATFHNREGVTIEMSDSDSDNFTKGLITILAERRCMLAVERPSAFRYGDLTPA